MNAPRYSEPTYAARYLEAEWGDYLLEHAAFPEGQGQPLQFMNRNVRFYSSVVEMLQREVRAMPGFSLSRVADVGSASGRLIREICKAFSEVMDARGYEPSPKLCRLAHQMVLGEELPSRLPMSDKPLGGLLWLDVTEALRTALRRGPAVGKATFYETSAEGATVPLEFFDLVCCLNVLDRHPDPQALVDRLRTMMRPGGLLCISSPLDWEESSTPKDRWRDSVRDFLPDKDWQIVDRRDIDYRFRVNNRRVVQYSSEVVLSKRLG